MIPAPKLCPDCRQQRRLSWRNERSLYKRKCDATGKDIVSIYSPDKPHTIYNQEFWWSDNWDALDHGINYDENAGFFSQFSHLLHQTPLFGIYHMTQNSINSEYSNHCLDSNNTYYCASVVNSEDILYSNNTDGSTSCIDCSNIEKCESSYNLIDCEGCYNCISCQDCIDCSNCI